MPTAPKFSVIIPVEVHRNAWELCFQQWCRGQDFPRDRYEVIAVAPRGCSERVLSQLKNILTPEDGIARTGERHDVALRTLGAPLASGEFLVFTETGCVPGPDALRKCLEITAARSDWAGFSCRPVRVTHNRLSEAEADLNEAEINHRTREHPWRRILDECFVTRRDCYFQSGGFEPRLGHFAESALAARYNRLGFKVGFAPDVTLDRHYSGDLSATAELMGDFAAGEMRYFADRTLGIDLYLFDTPPEWQCRGDYYPPFARELLVMAFDRLLPASRPGIGAYGSALWTVARWLIPAVAGARGRQIAERARRWWHRARLALLSRYGPQDALKRALNAFINSIVHEQRLAALSTYRNLLDRPLPDSPNGSNGQWDVLSAQRAACAGLQPVATWNGAPFRWAGPVALISGWLPAGRHTLQIECLPLRPWRQDVLFAFFFNGVPVPPAAVIVTDRTIDLTVEVAGEGPCRLAWTCVPLRGGARLSRTTLPIGEIRWAAAPDTTAAA